MTAQDLFKLGFLHGCAADGLTLPEMEKRAEDLLHMVEEKVKEAGVKDVAQDTLGLAGWLRDTGLNVGKNMIMLPAMTGLVAGGLGGAALGSMQGLSDEDVEEEKMRELTDAYHRAAIKMRERANHSMAARTPAPAVRSLV